jgi:hypothetical protein
MVVGASEHLQTSYFSLIVTSYQDLVFAEHFPDERHMTDRTLNHHGVLLLLSPSSAFVGWMRAAGLRRSGILLKKVK